jgi:hypothetical protein
VGAMGASAVNQPDDRSPAQDRDIAIRGRPQLNMRTLSNPEFERLLAAPPFSRAAQVLTVRRAAAHELTTAAASFPPREVADDCGRMPLEYLPAAQLSVLSSPRR